MRVIRMLSVALLAAMMVASCGLFDGENDNKGPGAPTADDAPLGDDDDVTVDDTSGTGDDDAPIDADFEPLGSFVIGSSGKSEVITLPISPEAESTAIRVRNTEADQACYQLESIYTGEAGDIELAPAASGSADWGSYCTSCEERTALGMGYGLFLLPNSGFYPRLEDHVDFTVAIRNCEQKLPAHLMPGTYIPPAVEIDYLEIAAPPTEARGELPMRVFIAQGGQFDAADPEADTMFAEAVTYMTGYLAQAGIDVVITGYHAVQTPAQEVIYSAAERTELDELYQSALDGGLNAAGGEAAIIIAPCLKYETSPGAYNEADGYAANIPGGVLESDYADAVFLRGRNCGNPVTPDYWLSGRQLGTIWAHELGHWLGLYHTVEYAGGEDHIDDTTADNLMYYAPLTLAAPSLSPTQIQIIRRHHYIRY